MTVKNASEYGYKSMARIIGIISLSGGYNFN
jgi:hypothetical protein